MQIYLASKFYKSKENEKEFYNLYNTKKIIIKENFQEELLTVMEENKKLKKEISKLVINFCSGNRNPTKKTLYNLNEKLKGDNKNDK